MKQPWRIWMNNFYRFTENDTTTTTNQAEHNHMQESFCVYGQSMRDVTL